MVSPAYSYFSHRKMLTFFSKVLIPIFSIVNPCLLASPFLAQLISLAGAGTISRRVLPEVSGQEPCAQVFNSSDGCMLALIPPTSS